MSLTTYYLGENEENDDNSVNSQYSGKVKRNKHVFEYSEQVS